MFKLHFVKYLRVQIKMSSVLKSTPIQYNHSTNRLKISTFFQSYTIRFGTNLAHTLVMLMTSYKWRSFRMLGWMLMLCQMFGNILRVSFHISRDDIVYFTNGLIRFESLFLIPGILTQNYF